MKKVSLLVGLLAIMLMACGPATPAAPPLGSKDNPIKMAIIPFIETQQLVTNMKPLVEMVEKESGYKIDFTTPTSYSAAVEAIGTGKLDVVWFGPLAYVLAHDKYGAEVILVSQQKGSTQYRGMFIVRSDSPYKSLEDLKGKRIAFTESSSTSGYLYPAALLLSKGYDPNRYFSDVVFAGGHDKAAIALYNGQVDVAAIFEDARDRVVSTIPDIKEKTRPIAYTEWIPNDNVAVGKHVPPEVKEKLKQSLMKVTDTPEGSAALFKAIGTEKLLPIEDKMYDPIRLAAEKLGIDLAGKVK